MTKLNLAPKMASVLKDRCEMATLVEVFAKKLALELNSCVEDAWLSVYKYDQFDLIKWNGHGMNIHAVITFDFILTKELRITLINKFLILLSDKVEIDSLALSKVSLEIKMVKYYNELDINYKEEDKK